VAFAIVLYRARSFQLRIDLKKFREILQESFPFAILILLMYFYFRIDSILLERMLPDGKTQVGIYAHSFRILDAAYMFATLFAGLLLPIFSRMLKKREPVGEMVSVSLTLILLPALFLASAGIYYSHEILALLYNENLQESSRIFPLLMITFIGIAISHIFGTLLTANRNLKALNLLAATAIVVNLSLNLILIPEHKAYGSAIASLTTAMYMAAGQVLIAHRKIKLSVPGGYTFRILLSVPLIFLGGLICQKLIGNWYAGIFVLWIWTGTVAFVLKLVRPADLRNLMSQD
jgi:O-antigen/teichoic acid export membrane protein